MRLSSIPVGVAIVAGYLSCPALVAAQPPLPTRAIEAHANTKELQESPPGASTKAKVTTPKGALLPPSNREAIKSRLADVRREIEKIEDDMYRLTDKYPDALVTSRDRWHSELDRVQTEIRQAKKDLAEAATKSEQMELRMKDLLVEAEKERDDDKSLVILHQKWKLLDDKLKRLPGDAGQRIIKPKSLSSLQDSVKAEMNDTEMEIAQRTESLTLSYKGGQADQLKKQLKELAVDVKVKESALKELTKRFDDLQKLSEEITKYARMERSVDELQILHRKLAELNAQQEVEFLKSTDPDKVQVVIKAKNE